MAVSPHIISRILAAWMGIITLLMVNIAADNAADPFYRFGPQPDLVILGYTIDTLPKYGLVIVYALANTVVRNLNHNIIAPWITLNVQDTGNVWMGINRSHAYEISLVSTLYSWFDWLIYIHMLLAQVDMVLIEMGTDVLSTAVITYWYLNRDRDRAALLRA